MAWSSEQVIALAPDASSASSGKSLGSAHKWKTLGANESCAWGSIQGSGKNPYQTCIDLSGPAFKCSCPSRKFPCKHGLGLFLILAQQPAALTEKEVPPWAAEWLAKRTEKEEKKTKEAEKPPDPEAQAKAAAAAEKRAASRESNVNTGLDELGIFIADLVRAGFATLPSKPPRYWETPAARMVDAQAPGLARRLRSLYGISSRGEAWPGELLRELSLLHLIREGWGRLTSLPEGTQADLRAAIGFNLSQDAVLLQEGVHDSWIVLGQRILGDDERLRTQRTWLAGQKSGRVALSLSFSAGSNQPFDITLVPGTTIDAELVFFPSAFPLRALVKNRTGTPSTVEPVFQHKNISGAIAFGASAFAANPWIERVPFALSSVIPRADNGWRVVDTDGKWLKLDVSEDVAWTLMSLSGGHPIALAGEWDGACLYPISAWAEGRFHRCDR
ncbi:MAG TPA: SWIM zinc finger family protein [Candidatus Kapabacteria bacterium]|nr:SWIM zinc finger family protein [Candidatus Kapabacteria bacterium]